MFWNLFAYKNVIHSIGYGLKFETTYWNCCLRDWIALSICPYWRNCVWRYDKWVYVLCNCLCLSSIDWFIIHLRDSQKKIELQFYWNANRLHRNDVEMRTQQKVIFYLFHFDFSFHDKKFNWNQWNQQPEVNNFFYLIVGILNVRVLIIINAEMCKCYQFRHTNSLMWNEIETH